MDTLSDSEVRALADDAASDRNHSAYRRNPFHKSIDHERIYFYYVTDPTVKPEPVPAVYIRDPPSPLHNRPDVLEAIAELAQNAVVGGNKPHPIGEGFEFVKWTMRSLIVIVIDYPNLTDKTNWQFHHDAAIVFCDDGVHTPNHTFYDAFDYSFNVRDKQGNSRRVTALCFENHMAGADKRPLGAGEEKFKYTLYAGPGSRFYPYPIDPGGTNLGPPPDIP